MKLFKRTVSVLLIIIVLNIALVYGMVYRSPGIQKLSASEIDSIQEMLKNNDIQLDSAAIPKKYSNIPSVQLINSTHSKLAFAQKLYGKNFVVIDSSSYSSENSTLTFEGNSFIIDFSEPLLKKEFLLLSAAEHGKLIKKAVSELNFASSSVLISVHEGENKADIFRVIDSVPIFDNYFTAEFSENGISRLSGVWFEESTKTEDVPCRSLVSVLYGLASDERIIGHAVTEISLGYRTDITSDYCKEITAHPTWRIVTDNKTAYYY